MNQIGIGYSFVSNSDDYYRTYEVDNSNNYFRITDSYEDNIYFLGEVYTHYQIVEGEFSATLKNENDENDEIQINNGKFKIEVSY